jgi:hypothetical protein
LLKRIVVIHVVESTVPVTVPSGLVREESGKVLSIRSTVASNTAVAVAMVVHPVGDRSHKQASAGSADTNRIALAMAAILMRVRVLIA